MADLDWLSVDFFLVQSTPRVMNNLECCGKKKVK